MKNIYSITAIAVFLLMLITPFMVNAQNSLFMIPQNPESYFNVDTEISNTGAGVCEVSYLGSPATLSVMVWDGEQQGFGWDLDYGSETGYQSLYIDEYINDPDIVVADGDWGILAHIVYEYNEHIYYEIWEYDMGSNSWSIFQTSTQLSDDESTHPNIDRVFEDVAVVWNKSGRYIYGATGKIFGNYNNVQEVYITNIGQCIEPDVAVSYNSPYLYISVVFRQVDGVIDSVKIAKYSYYNFNYSNLIYTDELINEGQVDVQFGIPRIAAYHNKVTYQLVNNWPYEVVMVERNKDRYYVHGFNTNNPYNIVNWDTLNNHTYESELDGGVYDPRDYETKEPVVSFLEDLNVAWAYKAPETGNWEIVYRTLESTTGDVRNSYHGGYSYTYSLVNGYDASGWEQGNQHHPCIASRFSVDEKIIGWYDDETYKPDYKLRQLNVEIFGLEEENDPDIIYPNPSSRWLNIALPEGEKQADFIMFSLQGKPVMRGECQKEFNSFDVSGLSKGIYFLDIKLKSRNIRKKFVKL